MKKIQAILEFQLFGVCSWLGELLGIASGAVRMTFIYLCFFTFGSPIILYVALIFLMNLGTYLRRRRSTIWDF